MGQSEQGNKPEKQLLAFVQTPDDTEKKNKEQNMLRGGKRPGI